MKTWAYAWLHLTRNIKQAWMTAASYLVVLFLIASLQASVLSRQELLLQMADSIEIKGSITDQTGYVTEGLWLDESYLRMFTNRTGSMYDDVKDVRLKVNELVHLLCGVKTDAPMIALNHIEADLSLDGIRDTITYEDGYDQSLFEGQEQVCIIGSDVEPLTDEEGRKYIDMVMAFGKAPSEEEPDENNTARFYVAGYVSEKGLDRTVFVPYAAMLECCPVARSTSHPLDSLFFTVKNNQELDILRTKLAQTFTDIEQKQVDPNAYAVVLQDSDYLELWHEAQKILRMMQILQPVLYLCALGAGVMLVVMQMRGRKKEMAVIRSLGAGRLRVMAQSILEYALICLPVTLFALLVWRELSPMTVFGVWLAFMAGALCTIVRFSMVPLVKQIRELEE